MIKTMTNKQLLMLLSTFPPEATIEPYDGEVTGIRIDLESQPIGFIHTETTGDDFKVDRYE